MFTNNLGLLYDAIALIPIPFSYIFVLNQTQQVTGFVGFDDLQPNRIASSAPFPTRYACGKKIDAIATQNLAQ
ncbi:MAG: hypothetical protein ACYTXC_20490 [Nostoc sp.]